MIEPDLASYEERKMQVAIMVYERYPSADVMGAQIFTRKESGK